MYMVKGYKENAMKTFRNNTYTKWESFKAKLVADKKFKQNLSFEINFEL